MDANVAAMLPYLVSLLLSGVPYLPWVAPLIIFILEKNSRYVRFYAMQALLLQAASVVLLIAVAALGGSSFSLFALVQSFATAGVLLLVLLALALLAGVTVFILNIVCTVKAYKYKMFQIPLLGNLAQKLTDRFPPNL